MEILLKPIGYAKNSQKKHFGGWAKVKTQIVINKEYEGALLGLEEFSHIIVVFWMHEAKTCDIRHVPQGKVGIVPEVGIFACRCIQRPNPIGISSVKLLNIEKNILTVQGLDVIENTPIVDIKPYTPQYDSVPDAQVPQWIGKLDY